MPLIELKLTENRNKFSTDTKRKKFNVYAETREQCEAKLAEMIAEKKAEIAEEKVNKKSK